MEANPQHLNVFKGRDSLQQYLDPDQNPLLPLVEIPDALNPLRGDSVRIFAKMLTALPAHNVKSLPALQMLRETPRASSQTIVEASSGSTVFSLAILARALWGNEDVHAYVTNKKHPDSLRLMKFFGLKTVLYGGLAQQEPTDERGVMGRLRKLAELDENVCYPGQYDNDQNWKAHERWTGTQIWKQLPEVNVFCTTVGTGGCITGTSSFLKAMKPSVRSVGVCSIRGDPIPGPRYFPGFHTSPFPWRETIDVFEDVPSANAFLTSMKLSRHGIIAGPSSGQALCGLLAHLSAVKSEGRLSELAEPTTGEINCVFVCADLPYQYMDLYFKRVDDHEFPPTVNQNLLACDQDPYDERWFLSPEEGLRRAGDAAICSEPSCCCSEQRGASIPLDCEMASSLPPTPPMSLSGALGEDVCVLVVDVRPREAYAKGHLQSARNVPLSEEPRNLFWDAQAVEERWREIHEALDGPLWPSPLAGVWQPVLVVCGNGDTARMVVSILRSRGREAFSVEGGYETLAAIKS